MTVVIQTRDRNGRTIVTWYEDMHEADRARPIAFVGASGLWVDPEADYSEIGRRATNLYNCELLRDPWQDLSHMVTHTRDSDGYLHAVKAVTA